MNWKEIAGFEGIYSISDTGQIRRDKAGPGTYPGFLMTIQIDQTGYARCLLRDGKRIKRIIVHRELCKAFIGEIPDGMQVNHINGVKSDNRLENLEIVTPSQNHKHAFLVLGKKASINPNPGTKNGRAKLDDEKVKEIRRLYSGGGITQKQLAKVFGINQTNISGIIRRETWAHVPG